MILKIKFCIPLYALTVWWCCCRLGMKPELVTASDREKTKRVVYAVIYGVGECCHSDHNGTMLLLLLQVRRDWLRCSISVWTLPRT